MSQSADYLPVGFLLPRIKANYFCVNVWRSKTLSYICYVNNDKQTHNDMNENNPSIHEAFEAILELVELDYMD